MIAKSALLAAVLLIVVSGCSRQATSLPATPPLAIPHIATPEEWRAALSSSYTEINRKEGNDGKSEFMAKFNAGESKANTLTFGERDAFRKLRIFKAGMPMQISTGVKAYVSIPDNEAPVLFLQPYFWGRNGWLFLDKVSVMVNGEVILDHACVQVERETEGVGVAETCDIIVTNGEINELRKVVDSAKVVVRLTGNKGYVTLDSKAKHNMLDEFKRDIQSAIAVYDAIHAATKNHIPPKAAKRT